MVQRIDRLYEQNRELQRQQDAAVQRKREEVAAEERADGRVRRENIAEQIAPHMHDQVQISDEAREVMRNESSGQTSETAWVDEESLQQVRDTWYASGYQQALDSFENERSV